MTILDKNGDPLVLDDVQATRFVQLIADEWWAREETYNAGGANTAHRDAKRAVYRACGFLFGAVTLPPDLSVEDGSNITRMPERTRG